MLSKEKYYLKSEWSSTLVNPASVTVLGVAKDRQGLNPEEVSSTLGAKVKKSKGSEESSTSIAKDMKTDTPKEKGKARKNSSPARVSKPCTDNKLEKLDQKQSERFNRLEAYDCQHSPATNQPTGHSPSAAFSPA